MPGVPAETLYPSVLAALAELLEGRGDGVDPIDSSLRAWEEGHDVEAHLRHHVARMGSLLDSSLASWDERRREYVSDHWHEACWVVLLQLSWETARFIRDGRGAEPVPLRRPTTFEHTERTEACVVCSFEFVHEHEVEGVAAYAWRELVVRPAAQEGRGSNVAKQALAFKTDSECRAYAGDSRAALRAFGLEIMDDVFRNPVFEEMDLEAVFEADEITGSVEQIGGDDPCPRCEANQWEERGVLVGGPPWRVVRGLSPTDQMDETLRSLGLGPRDTPWTWLKARLSR